VSAPSRDVLERTQARNGSQFSLSVVVPNPIRTVPFAERWAPAVADQAAVLFVGRFDRHKGGDIAIDAFARLRASGVMATLVFAGPDSGFLDDSGRRWHLRDYIADRLPDRRDREAIEILASQTPQALRELRRRAAVVVVPSRWEAFGYTLAEAMAQGCPIVASARGAFPEFLEHEKNGLLVGSESGDLWSEAIRRLLVDRELARELGENAAAAATAHLEPSAVANAALAFYSRAIASHSGGMK
jgi:glycosyltransferase involved in cell wall biosynthesis